MALHPAEGLGVVSGGGRLLSAGVPGESRQMQAGEGLTQQADTLCLPSSTLTVNSD